jgi:hypothetical protein
LQLSPIKEKDAFIYFDESHCRGSDMKLKSNAVALLTLGRKMCKDKLMQVYIFINFKKKIFNFILSIIKLS